MGKSGGLPPLFLFSFVKGRVHIVDVFLVHLVLRQPQALAEALEVDDFPGPKEFDGVADVRVIGEAENVVIGYTGFLLWCNHESATWG